MLEYLQKKLFRHESVQPKKKQKHKRHQFEDTLAECCEDVWLDSKSFF